MVERLEHGNGLARQVGGGVLVAGVVRRLAAARLALGDFHVAA